MARPVVRIQGRVRSLTECSVTECSVTECSVTTLWSGILIYQRSGATVVVTLTVHGFSTRML